MRQILAVLRQVVAILEKDLKIEWRMATRIFTLFCFGFTLLLLFSFAVGSDTDVLQKHAAAYLWMSVLLASTLQLERSFATETESGALEAILLVPTSPAALFYGKAIANWLQLLLLAIASLPLVVVLYGAELLGPLAWLPVVAALGTAGLAAPGTLYAGMVARVRGGQVLLPILLFPLVVPAVLAAVKATSLVLLGDPMGQVGSWVSLLFWFDVVFWALSGVLFTKVVEL
jgi:heme exporter protein B